MLETFDLLEADYISTNKVRYIVHPYYLNDPGSALAAEAAWCAQDQGKFFEFQHIVYQNQGQILYTQQTLTDLAVRIGLEQSSFAECLASGRHQADVSKARQAASRLGVNSTPTFFINNRRVTGNLPYPEFQQIIEQALMAAQ